MRRVITPLGNPDPAETRMNEPEPHTPPRTAGAGAGAAKKHSRPKPTPAGVHDFPDSLDEGTPDRDNTFARRELSFASEEDVSIDVGDTVDELKERIRSLQARLAESEKQLKPSQQPVKASDAGAGSKLPNLNDASHSALERRCKGVGLVSAWRVVQQRARGGAFASWDDLKERVECIGTARMKQLRAQFDLHPRRNVNTALAVDLEDALQAARMGKEPFTFTSRVAMQIVEEREAAGEFECWDDVLRRVSFGRMGAGIRAEDVVEWLRLQSVRCESRAAESAAAERAVTLATAGLPWLELRNVRIPLSEPQLLSWRVGKDLKPLAAFYGLAIDHNLRKPALVAAIMAKEDSLAFVEDLVKRLADSAVERTERAERKLAVREMVAKAVRRVVSRSGATDGDRVPHSGESKQQQAHHHGHNLRVTAARVKHQEHQKSVAEKNERDIWKRVAGNAAQLQGWRVKEELNLLAMLYGVPSSGSKATLIKRLLEYEREQLITAGIGISDAVAKGSHSGNTMAAASHEEAKGVDAGPPGTNPWLSGRKLTVGAWNMLHFSERTLGLGITQEREVEEAKHLDTILPVLASFDICAILELMDAHTLPRLCKALADHTDELWGWVQTPKFKEDKELVGFLWRKSAARLTSSKSGADDGNASTFMEDDTRALHYFHRPPAVARFAPVRGGFDGGRAQAPELLLVASHITCGGPGKLEEKENGTNMAKAAKEARELELHNLAIWFCFNDAVPYAMAGALECLAAKEPNAMVVAMGDFNTDPRDPAWDACKAAGWEPQLKSPTMALAAGGDCNDNVLLRGAKLEGATEWTNVLELDWASGNQGGMKGDEAHAQRVRVEVGVVDMMAEVLEKYLPRITKLFTENGGLLAHGANKQRVKEAQKKTVEAIFKGSISDHIPVRLDILLPTVPGDALGGAGGVGGVAPEESSSAVIRPIKGLKINMAGQNIITAELRKYKFTHTGDKVAT